VEVISLVVAKVIELVGSSTESFEDAIKQALNEAKRTVKGISGIDVLGLNAKVRNDEITEYRANVKVAFQVER